MTIAYITHPECLLHEMGRGHPESPQRLYAINDQLVVSGLEPVLLHREAPPVTREQLERVHAPDYVQTIFDVAPQEGLAYLDPDTAMNPHSLPAALRAAGAAVLGVDLVMAGEVPAAFCAVRPPGHHAERARAMGFCLFNNVAVGTAHAIAAHGLERVAVADFDVHHGNGTEDIFRAEPRVLLCSSFQHPYYPYSGADTVSDHIVNVPLPAGTKGEAFRAAIAAHWLPALEAFKPQLIMVSAGFDGHHADEMANLLLSEADYSWISHEIKALADRHCQGRIVSVLEGGYALHALGLSVTAHLKALLGMADFQRG
jgi:acetoin utilization deacetylase AcuC-like enzyme